MGIVIKKILFNNEHIFIVFVLNISFNILLFHFIKYVIPKILNDPTAVDLIRCFSIDAIISSQATLSCASKVYRI